MEKRIIGTLKHLLCRNVEMAGSKKKGPSNLHNKINIFISLSGIINRRD